MATLAQNARRALCLFGLALGLHPAQAETCTTQSRMNPSDRDALAASATALAGRVQAADAPGLRALSAPLIAGDFSAVSEVVGVTAPHLRNATLAVQQLYLLDASTLKPAAAGSSADAQFFCALNRTAAEAEFFIAGLPTGRYAFVMVDAQTGNQTPQSPTTPWRLSFLLKEESGKWLMAGFYPKPLTAAGHDGLWYWTQARDLLARKQPWNAWLYLLEADTLLQPAGFVGSSHLEKLRTEETSAAPPAVSDGVTPDAPLVIKAKDGTEFRFTSLGVDDSLNTSAVDVAVRLKADALPDQAAARQRNIAAMSALLAAHPELRQPFHGVWVFATPASGPVYATEQAMANIP